MRSIEAAVRSAAPELADRPLQPTRDLFDAWRQLHYAAQMASEVGKGWAPPQPDDSHSSLSFEEGCLVGAWAPGAPRFRAALGAADLVLSLVDEQGEVLARRELVGANFAEGMAWVRAAAAQAAGEPQRQRTRPAPDLPEHAVATGSPFAVRGSAFEEVARLLGEADAVLRAVADVLEAGPVRIWPHHFDLATLAVLEERPGEPLATMGVGLAVPDAIEDSGYWYVSPWTRREISGGEAWPRLPAGRWIERGGALRMAALPLGALAAGADRRAILARFLADAVGACLAALRG